MLLFLVGDVDGLLGTLSGCCCMTTGEGCGIGWSRAVRCWFAGVVVGCDVSEVKPCFYYCRLIVDG